MIKFLTFDNLFRHYNILAKTRGRPDDGYHIFPPKWRRFARVQYLVLRKSRSRSCPRLGIWSSLMTPVWRISLKFRSDHMSLPRSGYYFWLIKQIFNQSEAQPRLPNGREKIIQQQIWTCHSASHSSKVKLFLYDLHIHITRVIKDPLSSCP